MHLISENGVLRRMTIADQLMLEQSMREKQALDYETNRPAREAEAAAERERYRQENERERIGWLERDRKRKADQKDAVNRALQAAEPFGRPPGIPADFWQELLWRYKDGRKFREIAESRGLTTERIRQRVNKSERQLLYIVKAQPNGWPAATSDPRPYRWRPSRHELVFILNECSSITEVAQRHGVPESKVRAWIRQFGIQVEKVVMLTYH